MFRLSVDEWTSISSQFVMTSRTKRPKSALPFVFTEHGALMLASVLRSEVAIEMEVLRSRAGAPIIINSGYRSPQLNKKIGGVPTSNHLTGCAVDIRVENMEQLIRYAAILLDISNETHQDFDELLIEKRSASPLGSSKNRYGAIWLHFAVRPSNNRRKVSLIQA